MARLLKSLILSATLAALACAAPLMQDDCAVLAALSEDQIRVKHVSDCYNSFIYDLNNATETLNTLQTLYNDFWIFRDAALTPNLAPPFTSAPVDVLDQLHRIRQDSHASDFAFHKKLTMLANSVNDAHFSYEPDCYSAFKFTQPLWLYAPVIDGRQAIRVYKDNSGNGYTDCEVVQINGEDAQPYIQAYTDKNAGLSKDAAVRFNYALTSQEYKESTQKWSEKIGIFSSTTALPDADYIDYRIQCNGKEAVEYRGHWSAAKGSGVNDFTDQASFYQNICLASKPKPFVPGRSSTQEPTTEVREVHAQERLKLQQEVFQLGPMNELSNSDKDFPNATFVDGGVTAVYQLKSQPHVGVFVLPTMELKYKIEIPKIQKWLSNLAGLGATHLIIDTSNNDGGSIAFANILVSMFFPTKNKRTSAHLARYRVNAAAEAMADVDIANPTVQTYFNPRELADKTSFQPFTTNIFKNPFNSTVNGRLASYTDLLYLDFDPQIVNENITYPWTGVASNIVILTDGGCGSACGMFSELMVRRHGVKAIAVGGYTKKDLSMFSYAGASVLKLSDLFDSYESSGVVPLMKPLPYETTCQIPMIEMYSEGDTTPLEYNPARYIAAHRLDYTSQTARHRDKLWETVAETVWP